MTAGTTQRGFTLIEIIVTILLGSILAALMFQFMGTALTGSSGPVNIVRDSADMEALMEEVIADYVKRINANPATALALMKTDADALVYGSEVTMAYIEFDGSGNEAVPASPPTDTLKVTVQSAGHTLVTLLTNSRAQTDDPVSKY